MNKALTSLGFFAVIKIEVLHESTVMFMERKSTSSTHLNLYAG